MIRAISKPVKKLPKQTSKERSLQKKLIALENSRNHWRVRYGALKGKLKKDKQTPAIIAIPPPVPLRKSFIDKLKFWKR